MTSTPGAARRVRATQRGAPREHEPLPTFVDGLPELPAEYQATLAAGIRALGLAGLTPNRLAAIDDHVRLLLAWTEAINLTAIRSPVAVARDHVLDSLAAVPLLAGADGARVLDLGSGGGLPGVPLFVATEPRRMLLVESVGKKARFLAVAAAAVQRRLEIRERERLAVAATRAERLASDPHHRESWDFVLGRAVAGLAELCELALPLLRDRGRLVAWKREPLSAELQSAAPALAVLGGAIVAIDPVTVDGLEDHRLVVVEKVRRTPRQFPRDPAARRRTPLGARTTGGRG